MKMLNKFMVFALVMLVCVSFASAKVDKTETEAVDICGNEGFNCECQDFYNSTDYYAIEKWSVQGGDYEQDEENSLYSYYNIHVTGDLQNASWTSSPDVASVLVKAGNNRVEFDGGASGSVDSKKDISHITFCGYRSNSGGGDGGDGSVPEFPSFAIIGAVLVASLGFVLIRRN